MPIDGAGATGANAATSAECERAGATGARAALAAAASGAAARPWGTCRAPPAIRAAFTLATTCALTGVSSRAGSDSAASCAFGADLSVPSWLDATGSPSVVARQRGPAGLPRTVHRTRGAVTVGPSHFQIQRNGEAH